MTIVYIFLLKLQKFRRCLNANLVLYHKFVIPRLTYLLYIRF